MENDPASQQGFTHVNRRGEVYHLQARPRRGGGVGYSFTRKPTGTPVARIPDGYEAYESPEDAQVFLRKVRPSPILHDEARAVHAAVRDLAGLQHFVVEAEGKALIVYLPDTRPDDGVDLIRMLGAAGAAELQRRTIFQARYDKMMRFTLVDARKRHFTAERWCFRGSIDDWIYLRGPAPLATHLNELTPHLGRESFFELR